MKEVLLSLTLWPHPAHSSQCLCDIICVIYYCLFCYAFYVTCIELLFSKLRLYVMC